MSQHLIWASTSENARYLIVVCDHANFFDNRFQNSLIYN
jgi:hypothetical protein